MESSAIERRFLGYFEVDSGTFVIGDPAYLLPDASRAKPGIDYAAVLEVDHEQQGGWLGDRPVLLIQNFGGDGPLAVFGEFEDGEFRRVIIDLEPISLDNED